LAFSAADSCHLQIANLGHAFWNWRRASLVDSSGNSVPRDARHRGGSRSDKALSRDEPHYQLDATAAWHGNADLGMKF
jgi:hypothetical protein